MADPPTGHSYRIQSKATNHYLGVTDFSGDPGPHIRPMHYENEAALWAVERVDIGYRFSTGGPFDWPDDDLGSFSGAGRLDSNIERQVYAFRPNDGSYQKWKLFPDVDEGYWQLINVATGLALDGTIDDIYTQQPNDGAYQRWRFIGPV